LNLSTGAGFAPEVQMSSNSLGAFPYASQAPMSGDSAFLLHVGIDPFSIIADAQAKHLMTVSDLGLDPMCVRVPICVSQNLDCNPADLIPRD